MLQVDTSSKKEQRKFGIVMAVAITILGLLRWAIHGFHEFPVIFIAVAAVFLALGLIAPKVLQPVLKVWMRFAEAVNWVMTRLLLTVAFFGMIVPVRIIIHFFSDDPLKRAWNAPGETYWEAPDEQPAEFERYLNQF